VNNDNKLTTCKNISKMVKAQISIL